MRMENDSINQAKGMGIDQPRKGSGISTFSQDMLSQNPMMTGLKIEAGFTQPQVQANQQRNPLDVGLQVGNLGIDSFNTKQSAFSGAVIDQGIGATPVPRSALGGAANLGGDFFTQVTGKKDGKKIQGTGFGGSGEDDFLKVAGRSFAGVPQITGREPTVQGARSSARGIQQSNDIRDLNIAGGLDSLAGGIGRASNAVLLREKQQKKFRDITVKAFNENKGIKKLKEKLPKGDPILVEIGKIRKKRAEKSMAQRLKDEEDAREEQKFRKEFQRRSDSEGLRRRSEEALRRELNKRKLEDLRQRPTVQTDQSGGKQLALPDKSKSVSTKSVSTQNETGIRSPITPPTKIPFVFNISTVPTSKRKAPRFGEDIEVTTPTAGAFSSKQELEREKEKRKSTKKKKKVKN